MKKAWFFPLLIICWSGSRDSSAQEIDRLLAAVNGKVITALDLQTARTLNAVLELGRSEQPQSEREELDKLIQQELIRQEMENYPIPEAHVDEAVNKKIKELKTAYAEIGGLPVLLRQLGLAESELRDKVKTIVLAEMFVTLRFGPFVTVSPAEVESYYQNKLLPELKANRIAVPPLADVAPKIEALLKEEKKTDAWLQWLENIRKNSRIEYFIRSASADHRAP
jgi:hypothetical protein